MSESKQSDLVKNKNTMKKAKYLVTVPNRTTPEIKPLLIMHTFTLADARKTWKGSEGKVIYKIHE